MSHSPPTCPAPFGRRESRIQGKRRACGFFWARPPIVCVRLWVTGQKPRGMRLCGSDPGRILAPQSNPWIGRELLFIHVEGVSTEGVAASLSLFSFHIPLAAFGIAVAAGCCIRRDNSVHPFRGSGRRVPNQNAPSTLFAFATGIPFDAKKTHKDLSRNPLALWGGPVPLFLCRVVIISFNECPIFFHSR